MADRRRNRTRSRVSAKTSALVGIVTLLASLGGLIVLAPPAAAVAPIGFFTAPGPGDGSQVHTFTRTGAPALPEYAAYGSYTGGVFVASGDVNGDGIPDAITGADAGGGPHVRVVSGSGGDLYNFYAYAPSFNGGVRVASGDVNGDGFDDIITGAGPGGGPHVIVFSGKDGSVLQSFFAYTSGFKGGVFVAAGDVDGDGLADVITGAGPGGGPHVRAFAFDGTTPVEVRGFFAYDPGFGGGVTVGAGYMNGDLIADIITGAGPGGGPHVKVFDGFSLTVIRSFFAYSPAFTGGVYVSAADINGDEFVDIITGAGAGGGPHVEAFNGANTSQVLLSFFAYDPSFTGGVRVGGNPGTEPPTIAVTGGPDDGAAVTNPAPTYTGTAVDTDGVVRNIFTSVDFAEPVTTGVTCTGCGTANVTWAFTPTSPLSQGPHTVIFYALDNSGLIDVDSRDVIVDLIAGPPSVTINQAVGQADPTKTNPINFTATFSEPVTGFSSADVLIGGTATGTPISVALTPVGTDRTTWTVGVTLNNPTTSGTVTATIPAGTVTDDAGFLNTASTSTDNTVTWDVAGPTFDALGSNGTTTVFAYFNEPLLCTSVTTSDFTASVDGSPVAVSGATCTGTSDAVIDLLLGSAPSSSAQVTTAANSVTDAVGNAGPTPSATTRSANVDTTAPTVTVNQASGQADPTKNSPINFTATFSEAVTGFDGSDVTIGGTAGGTTATVTGSGTTYTIAISGMTSSGTVTASIPAGKAKNLAMIDNTASTSTDNSVTLDITAPTVTVNQASGQVDPTHTSPINFTATFSEVVTGFAAADVSITGTAGGTKTAAVSGSGTTYNIAVSGMTTDGTVVVDVPAGGAQDSVGNTNLASSSTDNSVTWDVAPSVTVNQASGQADPVGADQSGGASIDFTAVFSKAVTGFDQSDVVIGGTATGTKTAAVNGSGTTYTITITLSGTTGSGTVTASVPAGAAVDDPGTANTASTSTDNTVTFDKTAPTFAWLVSTTGSSTVTAVFTKLDDPIDCSTVDPLGSDFSATVAGTNRVISSAVCSGASDSTVDLVLAAPAVTAGQAVIVSLNGEVKDVVGNVVAASPPNRSSIASSPILTVSASSPAHGSSTSDTTPTFSGGVSDDGTIQSVEVSLDGGVIFDGSDVTLTCSGLGGCLLNPVDGWTYTPASPLAKGTYAFVFRAADQDGSLSQPALRIVTIT